MQENISSIEQVREFVRAKAEAAAARERARREFIRKAHSEIDRSCDAKFEICSCKSISYSLRIADRFPNEELIPPVTPRPPNLQAVNLSFAARLLLAIRDRFNGDAPRVYEAAHVSRQVYSQIISDETRPVSKRTAIRFAFALKLSPSEATLLLKSAGYAFSNAQTEDFVLEGCLSANPPITDWQTVNELLKEHRVDFQY